MPAFRFPMIGCLILEAATCCTDLSAQAQPKAQNVEWAGARTYRLLVDVEAKKLRGRSSDELPAELVIDFEAELRKLGTKRIVDIASIQIIAHDPATGRPKGASNYAYATSPFDRVFRWYDDAIPYEFPEVNDAASRAADKKVWGTRIRGGDFYNVLGDWHKGRLVWLHAQTDEKPTSYGVYFDLLPEGKSPSRLPPRGWVGDGSPRCDKMSASTTAAGHTRVDVDDWDGDGLVDLIVGEQSGRIIWWPNVGTKAIPEFRYGKFVLADGKPIDAGQAAAPKVVDWDGDGVKDLLVGTHWNRLLFYRNIGTNRDRKFVEQGPVTLDGKPLEIPISPLARGSADIFKRDYYPVPETVDWYGAGKLDLLMGGYVTGRIFLYGKESRHKDGTPTLAFRGPLEADGKPLNVNYWCAAPCVADLDGDGDLDLITGNFPIYEPSDRKGADQDFLQYFENVGTRARPKLVSRPFPGEGAPPRECLATPRAVDWDGDGDLDLVVGAGQNIYLIENLGTKTRPWFRLHGEPIKVPWGLSSVSADRLLDWNKDGRVDLIRGYHVYLNAGTGNPYQWKDTIALLPTDQFIAHPSKTGDGWFFPYLDDFDLDGKVDVLFGDWWGNIWLHRNLSTDQEKRFDMTGVRLKLQSGELIKVGPVGKDPSKEFDALQGARTVLAAADFDKDRLRDLVVGDTYGKIRYFRNLGTRADGSEPMFAEPVEIGDLGIRGLVEVTDWNQDGWPDVIASSANGKVRVILNQCKKGPTPFADGFDPQLPPLMQPRTLIADLNGDGDDDLLVQGIQGTSFVERSFLEHGYAKAKLITVEQRKR